MSSLEGGQQVAYVLTSLSAGPGFRQWTDRRQHFPFPKTPPAGAWFTLVLQSSRTVRALYSQRWQVPCTVW